MPPLPPGTYDPTEQVIVFLDNIIDGYAEETFIKASRNADGWSFKPSNSGGGARNRNPNKSGRFEFTLHGGSPSNAILSGIADADERDGTGIGQCFVKDRSSDGARCFAQFAWIVKHPDYERMKEIGDITWIIETDDIEIAHAGLIPPG